MTSRDLRPCTQRPVAGHWAETAAEAWQIVMHPAFRLGFLDAQAGRPFDHDLIMDRIRTETPPGALKRLGYCGHTGDGQASLLSRSATIPEVQFAQYRYEEGRLAVVIFGLRCRAWGHPDFPPAAIQRFVTDRAWERA